MNLLALKNKVIEKLKERSTPVYWPASEIVDNLNRGCRKFAADTKCDETTVALVVSSAPDAYFTIPVGLMNTSGVFWLKKKLNRTSAEYLDEYFVGFNDADAADWRVTTAAAPTHWLIDEGKIKLYPIPTTISTGNCTLKGSFIPTAMAADVDIPDLPAHLEHYHDAIWLWALAECYSREGQQRDEGLAKYYGELYFAKVQEYQASFLQQFDSPFPLVAGSVTNLSGFKNKVFEKLREKADPDNWTEFEIIESINQGCKRFAADTGCKESSVAVTINSSTDAYFSFPAKLIRPESISWKGKKLNRTNAAYLDEFFSGYKDRTGTGNSANGWRSVTADLPTHWLIEDGKIKLYPIPTTITAGDCTVRGDFIPDLMTANTDTPDLPDHLEHYYDSIWAWALFECYSKEGKRHNPELAKLYNDMYTAKVEEYRQAYAGEAGAPLPLSLPGDEYSTNLLTLKNTVIEKLRETTDPSYWPESEIVDSLNRSCRNFAADTGCKERIAQLEAMDIYNAYFKMPPGLISITSVLWKEKKLSRTSNGYLDDYFSGYGDHQNVNELPALATNWRDATAEVPTHWLIEDGKIKLYPVPRTVASSVCRHLQILSLPAGEIEIAIPEEIPSNKHAVDLYLNGVYQEKDQWEILYGNTIELAGPLARDQVVEIVWVSAGSRTAQTSALAAGALNIALASDIPTDQAYVDLYLNGVYQNQDQWTITNKNLITMVGAKSHDQVAEVVYYPAAPFANFKAIKKTFTLAAGEDTVTLPVSYTLGTNAVSVRLDGLSQAPSTFTEVDTRTIQLSAPVTREKTVEVIIYKNSEFSCSLKGVFSPTPMSANSDVPDLPDHLSHYFDAIWAGALAECYSKEGKRQNPGLVRFYSDIYDAKVREYKDSFEPPIEFIPRDPWRVF